MNVKEKLDLNVIQRLIDNKSFKTALKKIDMLIPTTTCIRKCVNLKVQCLLELGNYHDAYELYRDYFPYAMIDIEDLDAIKYLSKIHQHLGNKIQANKYENSYKIVSGTKEERELFLYDQDEKSYYLYDEFLNNDGYTKETLENIIIDNFQMLRIAEAAVYLALAKRIGIDISDNTAGEFSHYTQAEKFTYELSTGNSNIYCLISESTSQSNMLRDCCLVKALSKLGVIVYHIVPYYESGNETFSTNKCFELQDREGNIIKIRIPKQEEIVEIDFLSDMIKLLNDQNDTEDPIVLFGNSDLLMEMNEDVEISKILQMYFRHYEEQPITRKECLLLGSYLASISHIWGYDIQKEFAKYPMCDFSIIIPVRNSIKYLRETIQTCLEQDYKGSYEILISDNGWHNNVNVLDIVKSINNEKVRYIRTPFDLSLAKSFEFAYLNSRGKYLISFGADDGMIKPSLSIMNAAMNQYPDNNVLLWPRAIYFWPDCPSTEKNKLIFSYNLSNSTKLIDLETEPLIRQFALGNFLFTDMPVMYMVTCVKREHINKMIEFTGKFEDGDSQDVYTGFVNLFIEDKITYIDYPLVIGGNSEAGVGLFASQAIKTMSTLGKLLRNKYNYFRYCNYYSQDYRNTLTIAGFGTSYLMYREYVKVNNYKIKKDYNNKKDILIILNRMHRWLPEKYCDEALYLGQIESVAKAYGDDVYKQYIYERKKWNIQLRIMQIVKRAVKSEVIRKIIKNMYYYGINIVYGSNNRKNTYPNTNNIFSPPGMNKPAIDIDCSSYNIEGIKGAAEYLWDVVRRDIRLYYR